LSQKDDAALLADVVFHKVLNEVDEVALLIKFNLIDDTWKIVERQAGKSWRRYVEPNNVWGKLDLTMRRVCFAILPRDVVGRGASGVENC
jgi:hypothetical protein